MVASVPLGRDMPQYDGPALVAADEDASKALKSLNKGDLVAVRCPADGCETFWLASIVGARKQRTAIRWWERADTRERACADTVYQVGAEAEPQTRDFRKTCCMSSIRQATSCLPSLYLQQGQPQRRKGCS